MSRARRLLHRNYNRIYDSLENIKKEKNPDLNTVTTHRWRRNLPGILGRKAMACRIRVRMAYKRGYSGFMINCLKDAPKHRRWAQYLSWQIHKNLSLGHLNWKFDNICRHWFSPNPHVFLNIVVVLIKQWTVQPRTRSTLACILWAPRQNLVREILFLVKQANWGGISGHSL